MCGIILLRVRRYRKERTRGDLKMKFYVTLKKDEFNATFEFLETQDDSNYGNGIYATVLRNGKDFQYLDLRYNSAHYLGKEETFENWLESYFGNNLVSITKLL